MGVKGQTLPVVVFTRMIARRVAVQVEIRSFEEACEQANNCGGCKGSAHCRLFYKSGHGQANHWNSRIQKRVNKGQFLHSPFTGT